MPLVLGNWRVFGDSLAKTSIMSSVPLSRLFWWCPLSVWIRRLFLVASAYSLGQWGDRDALGMNIWIDSSHEETVTVGPYRGTKLTAKFQLFYSRTPNTWGQMHKLWVDSLKLCVRTDSKCACFCVIIPNDCGARRFIPTPSVHQ